MNILKLSFIPHIAMHCAEVGGYGPLFHPHYPYAGPTHQGRCSFTARRVVWWRAHSHKHVLYSLRSSEHVWTSQWTWF